MWFQFCLNKMYIAKQIERHLTKMLRLENDYGSLLFIIYTFIFQIFSSNCILFYD